MFHKSFLASILCLVSFILSGCLKGDDISHVEQTDTRIHEAWLVFDWAYQVQAGNPEL